MEMEEELRKRREREIEREFEEERKYNKERYEVLKKAVEKMREEGHETKFFQTQTDDHCKIM